MSSPRKKKAKYTEPSASNFTQKRDIHDISVSSTSNKRMKTENNAQEDVQAKKRKNFIKACEMVSYKAYFDQKMRFQLDYIPACLSHNTCKHQDPRNGVKVMPPFMEESLKIEMKSNMWREALEVCRLCVTPDQFLSANVLKDIVEIMLNAHDDEYADYTIDYLIDKCQEIFELNLNFHPPCLTKSLRKCYNDFLTSPMDLKENTFTNRAQFGYDKGIVKYCMNRLEYEISKESNNEPLIDKYENIPEDMRQSVKGLHWQKEKFEIYELLERNERIERLIAVLDSIIELLQYDIAIWHSRYTNNLGTHIMRSHKPLMAYYLWSNNVLFTGAVNNNCRQILRLFVHMIYLKYPEHHIQTMTTWLNTMIQTFYICENNSNCDYPNIGKYCTTFANEFFKIISEMPQDTIIKILERIKPDYMQYLLGTRYIKSLQPSEENDPIKMFTVFVNNKQWKIFPENTLEVKIFKKNNVTITNVKNFTNYLLKKCENLKSKYSIGNVENNTEYLKFDPQSIVKDTKISLSHILHVFYITLEAYLDAYNVQTFQDTLDDLNARLDCGDYVSSEDKHIPEFSPYTTTEIFIKKYRSIYQTLRKLILILQELKNNGELPNIFKVFEKIGLLGM